ncbi:MAG TPA: EAL domain-containing protein [Frankiaceae bacterium]|nr:EAL domain-containing protein [Frankiaceae bacterium]
MLADLGPNAGPTIALRQAESISELSLELAALTGTGGHLESAIVERVSELVGDATVLWQKDDAGDIQLTAFHHHNPVVRGHMAELARTASHSDERGLLPFVWQMAEPLVLDAQELLTWRSQMQPAYQEYFRVHGMVSLVIVPLRVRGAPVAILGVSRDELPAHTEQDIRFCAQVGAVVAVALDNEHLLAQLRDQLAEQKRATTAAHRAAVHDPLTGLANRRVLVDRLHSASSRQSGSTALLLIDLDGFKYVNDLHGHSFGDIVLTEVADRLATTVTASPRAGWATLVRLGGDEFAVLLSDVIDPAQPGDMARALLASLELPLTRVDLPAPISASIGVAIGPASAASLLLRHADIAMYRAKRERVGWTTFDSTVDAPAKMRLRDTARLRDAILGGQLRVLYQPLVRSQHGGHCDNAAHRVEALVRWQHPDGQLLLPETFLLLAKQAELMTELTDTVLDVALADVADWRERDLDVQVSVNVTADVMGRSGFLVDLRDRLQEHDLQPSALCLELTESELLAGGTDLVQTFQDDGICVAIDDFGTGYSSLAYLADLPLDRLKLDQSFVGRVFDPRIARLVGGLVATVHELGYEVVAEGVEDAQTAHVMDRIGVAWQQGFLYSRPLDAEATERWIRAGA